MVRMVRVAMERREGVKYTSEAPLTRRALGPVGEDRMYTSGWAWCGC